MDKNMESEMETTCIWEFIGIWLPKFRNPFLGST